MKGKGLKKQYVLTNEVWGFSSFKRFTTARAGRASKRNGDVLSFTDHSHLYDPGRVKWVFVSLLIYYCVKMLKRGINAPRRPHPLVCVCMQQHFKPPASPETS